MLYLYVAYVILCHFYFLLALPHTVIGEKDYYGLAANSTNTGDTTTTQYTGEMKKETYSSYLGALIDYCMGNTQIDVHKRRSKGNFFPFSPPGRLVHPLSENFLFVPIVLHIPRQEILKVPSLHIAWGKGKRCVSYVTMKPAPTKRKCITYSQNSTHKFSTTINRNITYMLLEDNCTDIQILTRTFQAIQQIIMDLEDKKEGINTGKGKSREESKRKESTYIFKLKGREDDSVRAYLGYKNGTIRKLDDTDVGQANDAHHKNSQNKNVNKRIKKEQKKKKKRKNPYVNGKPNIRKKRAILGMGICQENPFPASTTWPEGLRYMICDTAYFALNLKSIITELVENGTQINSENLSNQTILLDELGRKVTDAKINIADDGSSRKALEDEIIQLYKEVNATTDILVSLDNSINSFLSRPTPPAGPTIETFNNTMILLNKRAKNLTFLYNEVRRLAFELEKTPVRVTSTIFPEVLHTTSGMLSFNTSLLSNYFDRAINRYSICTSMRVIEPYCMPDGIIEWQEYIYVGTSIVTMAGILVSAIVGCIAIERHFRNTKNRKEVERSRATHSQNKGYLEGSKVINAILESYCGQGQFRAIIPFKCVPSSKPHFFTHGVANSKCVLAAVYKGTRLPVVHEKDLGGLSMGNDLYSEDVVERSSFIPLAMCDSIDAMERVQGVFSYLAQLLDRPEFMGYPLSYIRAMRKFDVNTFLGQTHIRVQRDVDLPDPDLVDSLSLEEVFGILHGMEAVLQLIDGSSTLFDGFTFLGMDNITKPLISTNIFCGGQLLGLIIITGPIITNAVPSPNLVKKSPRIASSFLDFQMMSSVFGHFRGCACKNICTKFNNVLFGFDMLIASCDNALWYRRFQVYMDALEEEYENKDKSERRKNVPHPEKTREDYQLAAQSHAVLTVLGGPKNTQARGRPIEEIMDHMPLSRDFILSPLGANEEWNLIYAIPTLTDVVLAGLIEVLVSSSPGTTHSIIVQIKAKRVKKYSSKILKRREGLEEEITRREAIPLTIQESIDSPKTDVISGYL